MSEYPVALIMVAFLKNFYSPSRLLTDDDYKVMSTDATVLEQDERGIKVLLLANGDILKIFRVKRVISGTNIYSYARRFCRNAKRLSALDIPTVRIKSLYHFKASKNTKLSETGKN